METSRAIKRFLASIGKKGGRSRIKRLTPTQRRALARKAARARWEKEKRARKRP